MNHKGFRGGFGSVPQKAKNVFNQPALDKLREMSQEPRYTNSAHYPRVFRQGMSSLSKATEEIRTVEDALNLKSIGPFLAKIIAAVARKEAGGGADGDGDHIGNSSNNDGGGGGRKNKAAASASTSTAGRKRKATASSSGSGAKRAPSSMQRQLTIVPPSAFGALATSTTSATGTAAAAQPARKRDRPAKKSSTSTTGTATSSTTDPAKPSAKQTAYARAVREGEGLSATLDQYGDWRVILLVDRRERKADHVQAKLLMSGIEAEVRQLPIGDMLWIARGVRKRVTPGSGLGLGGAAEKQMVEVVLGTVVERKTLEDLVGSLFGTRFEEQRLRLKNSAAGARQVLYLVEAEAVTDLPNCSGATLRYAMMQTQVHLGFAVVRTKGLDDTVRYLKRVHRRLMRRSFPSEFRSVDFESGTGRAIPTFTSPDGRVRRNDEAAAAAAGGAAGGAGDNDLLFQNPPVPPFEARRHTIYEEFKAKLELARESGTKSVKALHCAMLKQVDSLAIAKVHSLTSLYETPASLLTAYRDTLARGGLDEADSMVKDIAISNCTARARRIGPKSSTELAKVYTAGVEENDYYGEENCALKEGDEEQQLSGESFPPKATAAAAAAASSAAAAAEPAEAAPAKCTYGNCADLSSDDDDDNAYERTPRRRNDGKESASRNEGGDSDDDLNRKPSALPKEQVAAERSSSTNYSYDYDLSSDSDDSGAPPAAAPNQSFDKTNATTSSKEKPKSDCYDLTMDSSDNDNDYETNKALPRVVTDTSSATSPSDAAGASVGDNVQDGRRPRLSHDGVGDGDGGSDENANKSSEDSDSESSCDELVVRLRKKPIDSGEKARLYDTSSAAESCTRQRFIPSNHSDSSPDQPSRKQQQNQAGAGVESSSSDVEVIELLD